MLKGTTDVNETIKCIRKAIIKNLEISGNRVLNGLSVRGADLQKIIDECNLGSFDLNDSFMVFEIVKDDENYFIMKETETKVSNIGNFRLDFRIYGNACYTIGMKMQAMFKDEDVLYDFYENGIRAKDTSKLSSINEFINNTLWPRCDLSFKYQIRFEFETPETNNYFNQVEKGKEQEAINEYSDDLVIVKNKKGA